MPVSITTIYRHRLHALEQGSEIIVKRAGSPDLTGKFVKLSNDQLAIRCKEDNMVLPINYNDRVLLVERT